MDLIKAAIQDGVLGQDFLTWLWFRSEKNGWLFRSSDGREFNVYLEQRLSVRGGSGENVEKAVVTGPHAEFTEAKLGLRNGKLVDKALLRLERDGATWTVLLGSDDFSLSGLKTPKIETRLEEGDDPDAPFLEKMMLLEQCLEFVDDLYRQFLEIRLSTGWNDELRTFREWLAEQ
ncbi:hypothetical protein [Fundidesulfovibrio agrisoli]|uniref:hypothetical protein n=1 Tax=Fundidesulfovibrio agrisoli TaxID=2922717 RepID=UPI001FAE0EDD|nr:hypothetical protein [Fundidesulfovibrio agrisoli]